MTDYNALYQETPNPLGAPYRVIAQCIAEHVPAQQHILDIGCGQGRDALLCARNGLKVTGIDASSAGIQGSLQAAVVSVPFKK